MPNTPTEPAGTLSPALPGWLIPLSQLADSAAPTGGFSHSLGLETYVADGVVHDEPTFVCWLSAMLAGPLTTCDALAIRLIGEALEADPDDLAQVWRIDRLLQIVPGVDVAQEELRDPLVLLVAAGRAPGQIRFAVAQRHGRRQRGARALARGKCGGVILLQPEHLGAAAEAESDLGNDR